MNSTDLASMLDMLAQAVRLLPTVQAQPQAAQAQHVAPAAAGAALADWLVVYERLLSERGYKAQTLKNRRASLAHVRRLWGRVPVRSLKAHQVSKALGEFLPGRTSTARRVLAELRDVYTEAVANDWADVNPATFVRPPKHKIQRARLRMETWQAMLTLANTGPQRWVASMLLLALVTGQRRADLAKMAFDDVVDGCLRVEQQKQAGKGYGARVAIPLSLRLDVIGMTVGDVIEHCRASAKPGATLLRKAGGGPIEESSLSARFHEHILAVLGAAAHKQYGWPSLHEVRSLSARLYHAQGTDVQTLLGHKHAEMTETYKDDRGLSKDEWKRVPVPTAVATE